jgi:hypothetical protein
MKVVDDVNHRKREVPGVDELCTDGALSQLASSCLSISSTRETLPASHPSANELAVDGVPGFPDFPSMWGGEEGGARKAEQTICVTSSDSRRSILLNLKRRIIVRQAVNMAGITVRRKNRGFRHQHLVPTKNYRLAKKSKGETLKQARTKWQNRRKWESSDITTICQAVASIVLTNKPRAIGAIAS